MNITEVRIKLMDDSSDRLRGFCSITFDDAFVIRDLKIIEGASGPFVAMPSRKLTAHCGQCGCKNHLRASYCNQCGVKLNFHITERGPDQRAKLYADIAHPINSECREMIQDRVIQEYQGEIEESKRPGYRSRYDEMYGDAGEDYEPIESDSTNGSHSEPGGSSPSDLAPVEDRPEVKIHSRHDKQNETRGPHTAGSGVDGKRQASRSASSSRGFGAGIFDD